jgi:hypothetical protein
MREADFRERVVRNLWNGRPLDEQEAPGRRECPEPDMRAQLKALRWLTDIAQPTLTVALRELIAQGAVPNGRLAYGMRPPCIEVSLWRAAASAGPSDVRWALVVAEDGSITARSLSAGRRLASSETLRTASPNFVITVMLEAFDEFRRHAWNGAEAKTRSA